jgi:serine/threonine protein kinase
MEGYVFHMKLGSGGQGTVWLACRQRDDTRVAIKICQSTYQRMLSREVENLHALTRLNHPNVVRFIDYLERDNALVMEYIDGLSLKAHLAQCNGKLEWEEASIAMQGILSGVQQLHSMPGNPMLHRDVTPTNIMLRDAPVQHANHVVLVDFGLSKRENTNGQSMTQGEMFVGTPGYMSVEAARGIKLDTRADVWSAGVIMYEMLAGRRPFTGGNDLQVLESIKNDKPKSLPTAGDGVNAFIFRALEKEKENRFQDASDMLEVFKIVCEDRYSVPEELKTPLNPSKTYSREARSAQPQDFTASPASEVGRQKQEKKGKPRIVAFFAKKRTDVAEMVKQVGLWSQDESMGKDEVLKQLVTLMQRDVERLDLHNEAEKLMLGFAHPSSLFEVGIHAQPTFQMFDDCLLGVRQNNIRVVHLAGHNSSRCGFFWVGEGSSAKYDPTNPENLAILFKPVVFKAEDAESSGIECVVLNACETEDLGKKLREHGVPHVICWRSEVRDVTAMKFSATFYKALDYQTDGQRDYKDAFEQARVRLPGRGSGNPSSGYSERKPAKNQAKVAVDFVCLLSITGDLYPDTGFIRAANGGESTDYPGEEECCDDQDDSGGYEGEDDESTRNWREPGIRANGNEVEAATDYAAHAGKNERKCMELLGFSMTLPGKSEPIKVGEGIESNGFIKDPNVLKMWDVCSFTSGVWGFDKSPIRRENKAIEKARLVMRSPGGSNTIGLAVQALAEVEKYRVNDMRQHEKDNLLGLKWEKTIAPNPSRGRSLGNSGLATALTSKTEFTKQEWESFGITDLDKDDFIKSGNWTFIPEIKKRCPGTCPTSLRCVPCQSLCKPKWNCADCKRLNCKNCGSREAHEYQLKQITDTREALEKMIQNDLSAGVAALSDTTRGAGTGWQHAHDGVRRIQMSEGSADALKTANSHTESCAEPHDVKSWGVEQVIAFFERCKFPTEGVQAGEVDGESLVNLYQDPDAEILFTTPAPDGLGFNKVMFKGKFKKEMEKLVSK